MIPITYFHWKSWRWTRLDSVYIMTKYYTEKEFWVHTYTLWGNLNTLTLQPATHLLFPPFSSPIWSSLLLMDFVIFSSNTYICYVIMSACAFTRNCVCSSQFHFHVLTKYVLTWINPTGDYTMLYIFFTVEYFNTETLKKLRWSMNYVRHGSKIHIVNLLLYWLNG